jgi:hypothetical protein
MIHRVEHDLWNLRTRRIVKKDESRRARQCREGSANGFNGKVFSRSGREFGVENAFRLGLQVFAPDNIRKVGAEVSWDEQRPTYTALQMLVKGAFSTFAG